MKNKLLAAFLCTLILISALCGISVSANTDTVARSQDLVGGIVAYKLAEAKVDRLEEWISGGLADGAGTVSEWYVLALAQSGEYDFSAYEASVLAYLSENEVGSASSRLKYALCLSAVGSTDGYISYALGNSVGKQGVMSYIYGLHMLNNGYACELTSAQIIDKLISSRNDDGGWSISGKTSDADVTAMAIQSLAPHYENENVKSAVDGALAVLSGKQLADGDFASYGVPNPESTSQVIVALCSLGIDLDTDARFIKNGKTLIDALQKYRLSDGSLCHKDGGASSESATVQTLCAVTAYLRFSEGKPPLYILDKADAANVKPAPVTDATDTDAQLTSTVSDTAATPDGERTEEKKTGYKLYVSLAIVAVGTATCLVLLVLKKRSIKNFIAIALAVVICVAVVCLTDIKSADNYYGADITKKNPVGTVALTIRCDTIVGLSDSDYIPSDGAILSPVEIEIEEDDTVYSVLVEAARKYEIHLENNGSAEMAYISGINYLYELDFGDMSGWVYRVNGESPSVGCSDYILSDGDSIEWHYTRESGNDIK